MKKRYTIDDLSRMIDHTNLKTDATKEDMKKLCEEAKTYHFKMVAINQVQTKICNKYLKDTDIHVGAAIAFPLGQTTIESKVFETKDAIKNGATEIDYVINLSEVKEKNWDYIKDEMQKIVSICKDSNVISKVIFENAYLNKEEIIKLSQISKEIKPDFIKTSTGMAKSGAKVEDVKLMKKIVGDDVKVKAAGGIREVETFIDMIRNGAERIGCSQGIPIIEELKKKFEREEIDFIEI
ncbi:deoxyribose-phosphate aldolase [Helcococcus kunzii]|uniref:deoxyribose-phosphate aldolase n=1 Tax=Helcococcus kunzii TaxID=40091 RepID=UPI0024ADF20C|nr:deoxyribose-phosphate aldolase [Helcococcus kunzii]